MKQNGLHAICGHKEVVAALRNHEHFSSGKGVSVDDNVNKMLIGSTLNSDPPQHDVTRKITFAPLSPGNVRLVKDQIEKEAKTIVDTLLAKEQFDAASELAPYLPLTVVTGPVVSGVNSTIYSFASVPVRAIC